MKSKYIMLRGRNELAEPSDEQAPTRASGLARTAPHVVHVRIVRRGRERRHNYMRRWQYRGVDELRRQQTRQTGEPPGQEALDAAC